MQLFSQPQRQGIAPVVIPQDVPVFRIEGNGFYVDDQLIPSGKYIVLDSEPNMDMTPMNELAMEKMREFLTKIDVLGREKSVQDKTAFISALDAFDARHNVSKGGRRASILGESNEPNILGDRTYKKPKASVLEADAVPEIELMSVGREAANSTGDTGLGKKAGKLNG